MRRLKSNRGFTLMEAVIVITITGILAAVVAVFIRAPVEGYFDSARRAALTDEADTAARRVARDLRSALPNSLRQSSASCIEFIPTKYSGRYRAEQSAAATGDILDFVAADSSFDMFGTNPTDERAIAANDVIAVYNLGSTGGVDAYASDNTAVVSSLGAGALANETNIVLTASKLFPLASENNRFQVIPAAEQMVSYVCDTVAHQLRRVGNAASTAAVSCPATGGAVLASNVSACSFDFAGTDLQRNGLVRINLSLTRSGETVSLYHEVHVNNTP